MIGPRTFVFLVGLAVLAFGVVLGVQHSASVLGRDFCGMDYYTTCTFTRTAMITAWAVTVAGLLTLLGSAVRTR